MSNWKLTHVEFFNLCRYKGTEDKQHHIFFSEPNKEVTDKSFLVCGVNEDVAGASSNGSGKSSIPDIITWAIFGRTPRKSSYKTIINDTSELGSVTLTMRKGSDEVVISRKRGLTEDVDKKVKFLSIEVNGEDKSLRTPTLTQKFILNFFGFDEAKAWDDYLSKVYFSTTATKGFMSSETDPGDRQKVLERFLNLSVLDKATELAKEDSKVSLAKVGQLEERYDYLVETGVEGKNITALEKVIKVETSNIRTIEIQREENARKKVQVIKLHEEVQKLTETEKTTKYDLFSIRDRMREVKDKYNYAKITIDKHKAAVGDWDLVKEKYKSLQIEAENQTTEIETIQGTIEILAKKEETPRYEAVVLRQEIRALKDQMDKSIDCPHCHKDVMLLKGELEKFDIVPIFNEHKAKSELEVKKSNLCESIANDIDKHSANKRYVKEQLKETRDELGTLETMRTIVEGTAYPDIEGILNEAKELAIKEKEADTKHNSARYEIDLFKSSNNVSESLSEDIGVLDANERVLTDKIGKIERDNNALEFSIKQIVKEQEELKTLKDKIKSIKKESSTSTYWAKTIPKIKVKALETFIPLFESTANEYLESFGVMERVEFLLIKESKLGNIKAGFNMKIFDGVTWGDWEKHSKGEQQRVLLASGFALRDLSATNSSSELGFLLIDEILDNIDPTGIDIFFDMLNTIDGQKLIITHSKPEELQTKCDHLIMVTRKDNVSSVEMT